MDNEDASRFSTASETTLQQHQQTHTMNQVSSIGLGSDITKVAAALVANDRLGKIDLVIENTSDNDAIVGIKEFSGGAWVELVEAFPVKARGVVTKSLVLLNKQIGFFGSGNAVINVTTVILNPANRRGAQIDMVYPGRAGWTFDAGIDSTVLFN